VEVCHDPSLPRSAPGRSPIEETSVEPHSFDSASPLVA
jgi:hypothetical protein